MSRVEIVQSGLLLPGAGHSRPLAARVFDRSGREVNVAVTWASSDPNRIFIDPNTGIAMAQVASGSAQIVASASGVQSPPLMALVATPASGVVLVDDAQVLRDARDSDPDAVPDPGNTYTVVLRTTPAAGERLIATGSAMIAGEVVATESAEGGTRVTLRLVPLSALLPQLTLSEVIDLSNAPIDIAPDIAANYTVRREGGRIILTPRPAAKGLRAKAGTPAGTFAFDRGCETEISGGPDGSLPITFDGAPSFDFTLNPSLDLLIDGGAVQHVIVRADPVIDLNAQLRATLAFQGKVECRAELFVIRLPFGGALSLIAGGLIPIGFGAELSGKVTVANAEVGYRSTTRGAFAAGIDCASGCEVVTEASFTNSSTPTLKLPANDSLGDGLKFEPGLFGFAFAEVAFGNPFLKSLQFTGLTGKFGAKLEGNFGSAETQIADAAYASDYGLKVACEIGPGVDLSKAVQLLFASASFIPKKFECNFDAFTQLPKLLSATADRGTWQEDDEVSVKASFNPASLDFVPDIGPANIAEVRLVRLDNSGAATTLASVAQPLSSRNTQFTLDFVSDAAALNGALRAGSSNELFIFVITRLLPFEFVPVEVGAVTANQPPVATDDAPGVSPDSRDNVLNLLANDTDADNDPLTVASVTQPANGEVTIAADLMSVAYTPNPGFSGTDTFDYVVEDGNGGEDVGTVVVTVSSAAPIELLGGGVSVDTGSGACVQPQLSNCPSGWDFLDTVARESFPAGSAMIQLSDSFENQDVDGGASARASASYGASAAISGETLDVDFSCDARSAKSVIRDLPPSRALASSLVQIFLAFRINSTRTFTLVADGSNVMLTRSPEGIGDGFTFPTARVRQDIRSSSGSVYEQELDASSPPPTASTVSVSPGRYTITLECDARASKDNARNTTTQAAGRLIVNVQ